MSTDTLQIIDSLPDLLAHALAMETEAAERYEELADQMETHRKTEVAAIFRKLEKEEKEHLKGLEAMCARYQLPHYAPWEYKWNTGGESPEAIAIDRVSYRMTARAAVELALDHERRAVAFYSDVAVRASDFQVKTLASQFATEESEHIAWLEASLAAASSSDASSDDPDPPLSQE